MIYRFTSPTCIPCKAMKPILDRAIAEGYHIETSDITETNLYEEYGVTSVPTFIRTENGHEINRHVGAMTYNELIDFCS